MENEQEILDSQNEEELQEEVVLEEDDHDFEKLQKEIATLKAQKEHWKAKASKPVEKTEEPKPSNGLSTQDLYALVKSNVAEEDISEIQDYAKMKNIPVAEALRSPVVQTLLRVKEEERKTASATHSGTSKRTTKELSEDVILDKARKGELPDNDADLARLIRARKGYKN